MLKLTETTMNEVCRLYEKINGVMLILMAYSIALNDFGIAEIVTPNNFNPIFLSFYLALVGFSGLVYRDYNTRSVINVLSAAIWSILATSTHIHSGFSMMELIMIAMAGANTYLFAYQGVMGTNKL